MPPAPRARYVRYQGAPGIDLKISASIRVYLRFSIQSAWLRAAVDRRPLA